MFVCLGLTCFSVSSFVGNVSDCIKKCLLGFVSIEFEFCSGVIRELNHCHLETHEIKQQGEEQKQTAKVKYVLFQNLCSLIVAYIFHTLISYSSLLFLRHYGKILSWLLPFLGVGETKSYEYLLYEWNGFIFSMILRNMWPWPGSDFQDFHALQCRESRMCKGNSLP